MTSELTALAVLALFAGGLWIPYIVAVNMQPEEEGRPNPFVSPPDVNKQPDFMRRRLRAHLNLLEQLLPFALLIIIAHLAGISNAITVWVAWIFVVLRVAYAVVMINGKPEWALRPIIFTAGFVCILVLGWQVLAG